MSGQTIVNQARKRLGENGKRTCDWYPLPWGSHWCCAFLDKIFFECKAQKKLYGGKKVAYVPTLQIWLKAHYPKVAIKNAKPGDIVIFTWSGKGYNSEKGSRDHIGIIRKTGTKDVVYSIEGNTGGTSPKNSAVRERTRSARYVYAIYRPPYEKAKKKVTKTAEKKKATTKKTEVKKTATKKTTVDVTKKLTTKYKKGFDVSYAQPNLSEKDFKKAKEAGFKYVIIRVGTRLNGKLYTDQQFESKYKKAKKAGLKIGVYFYSLAKTADAAKKEAEYVVKVLDKRKLQLPVFIDFEDPSQKNLGKKVSKALCEKFCAVVEKAGYKGGVYASYDYLTNRIDSISKKYYVWLAQYPKSTYKGRYEMHQYTSTGSVPGIGKKIDVNRSKIPYGEWPKSK